MIQETFKLINDLSQIGMPMGLLSNIYLGVFDILSEKSFLPYTNWKAKVLSSEVGFIKPESEIYKIAEEQAGVSPDKILFIDDKEDFLKPAIAMGWQTFLFDYKDPAKSIDDLRKLIGLKKVLT